MNTRKFLHAAFVKSARKYVENTINQAHIFIKANSPVKSGKYTDSTFKTPIIETETMVTASIVNKMEYSVHVETGWRSKEVNWHLADGTIYRAKWAKVFEKAKKYLDKDLKNF